MKEYFVDLHIHIGRTFKGKAVKITASRNLTFSNIIEEASERKGIDMIGIIDMHSPQVIEEVEELMQAGAVHELEKGGLRYKQTTVILGCEVEMRFETLKGTAHFLVFMPTLAKMKGFSSWLATKVKNIHLSTQRIYASMAELQDKVNELDGMLIPAHVFTPFKSVYGNCTESLANVLDTSQIPAVELGLSSDTDMADCISELHELTFVTNSDAHSLAKIAREYQKVQLADSSFEELRKALWRSEGRGITANYGLNPKLGKYHLTRCAACSELVKEEPGAHCPYCGHAKLIQGVSNRLHQISDLETPVHPSFRPPYIHQVPLEFIPKLGPKKMQELLNHFHTEMNILHQATEDELTAVVGSEISSFIVKNRHGEMHVLEGGGGKYGKVLIPTEK
jgi:uncharacterized protein (TIGR00375 family)